MATTPIVHVFILCYNEEVLIKDTILHYKRYLPNCKITIYDNESTDSSVAIAISHGCDIVNWNSNDFIDDKQYIQIKDNCWKTLNDGEWAVVIDMDEWLCITEVELAEEDAKGTTILNVEGCNVIGDSQNLDLSDIDLHGLNMAIRNWHWESKNLCFKKGPITDIRYGIGAHDCRPIGELKYSDRHYINKHMEFLGLPFIINKFRLRNQRIDYNADAKPGHYSLDVGFVTGRYNDSVRDCRPMF